MGQIVSDVTDIIDYKKTKDTNKTEKKRILEEIAADEKNKTNLVKKALATQRAKYGSSGMTGTSTTEEAVLKRLKQENAEPYNQKKRTNLEKISKLKTSKTNLIKSWLSKFDDIVG